MAQVISVNVGTPREADWAGIGRTAIDKQPGRRARPRDRLGLEGDQVGDTKHHGGLDQAVYAFAREDLDWWEGELGREIRDGQFAENLTTRGIDVNEAEVGERWRDRHGAPRGRDGAHPLQRLQELAAAQRLRRPRLGQAVRRAGRPGPYLRVIQEGELQAGDDLVVVHQPGHGVTVSTMFRALTTERSLLPELPRVENLAGVARRQVEAFVG